LLCAFHGIRFAHDDCCFGLLLVNMSGEYVIANRDTVWAALKDPEVPKACNARFFGISDNDPTNRETAGGTSFPRTPHTIARATRPGSQGGHAWQTFHSL
jgi:hypothetical protein